MTVYTEIRVDGSIIGEISQDVYLPDIPEERTIQAKPVDSFERNVDGNQRLRSELNL